MALNFGMGEDFMSAKKVVKKKVIQKKVDKVKVDKKKGIEKKVIHKKLNNKKVTPTKTVKTEVVSNKSADASTLQASLLELIRVTSTVLPDDVQKVILEALEKEQKKTTAEYAMKIIEANIALAKKKSQPLCQDTGTILFFVAHPRGFSQKHFIDVAKKAVVKATKLGYLRQNSVDTLTGENKALNIGLGHPSFHFHEHSSDRIEIKLMLKGGGCENVGAQYSLPYTALNAGRDLNGVRKVILDAIVQAQGKGCGPGVLGVCIGGDRGAGYVESKEQLLRKLDDQNMIKELQVLEEDIVQSANQLGIGPMGFGGKTTLLGCKIGVLNRLPASYFVSVSYMCWAFRRQGVILDQSQKIKKWLY